MLTNKKDAGSPFRSLVPNPEVTSPTSGQAHLHLEGRVAQSLPYLFPFVCYNSVSHVYNCIIMHFVLLYYYACCIFCMLILEMHGRAPFLLQSNRQTKSRLTEKTREMSDRGTPREAELVLCLGCSAGEALAAVQESHLLHHRSPQKRGEWRK